MKKEKGKVIPVQETVKEVRKQRQEGDKAWWDPVEPRESRPMLGKKLPRNK